MDKDEFYTHFCTVMRRCGHVKLKQIAAIGEVPLPQARKYLNELVKEGRIQKIGASRATSYLFK